MRKLNYIFLFLGYLLLINTATAQNTDNEKLQNAKHALDAYNDCQTALNNLNDISAAAQKQKDYLLYMGKAYECKSDNEQALTYYNKILAAYPDDQIAKDKIKAINDEKQKEAGKKKEIDDDNSFIELANSLVGNWSYTNVAGAKKKINIYCKKDDGHFLAFATNDNCFFAHIFVSHVDVYSKVHNETRYLKVCYTPGCNPRLMNDIYEPFKESDCNFFSGDLEKCFLKGRAFFSDANEIEIYLPKIIPDGQCSYTITTDLFLALKLTRVGD